MTLHTSFIDNHDINTTAYINKVYNSKYMLTLDDIPDVYHYNSTGNTDVEFELETYTAGNVKKGEKITFSLEGTPNAYTNGGIAYEKNGEWTADEWEGTYDSNGKLKATPHNLCAVLP